MAKNWQSKIIPVEFTEGSPGKVLEAYYFYYDTTTSETEDLEIVCGGYEKCSDQYQIDRKGYPYYFIKYTTKGKGKLYFKDKDFDLMAGTISGFSPSAAHRYISDCNEPMEHIFLTFRGKSGGKIFHKLGLEDGFAIHTSKPDKIMELLEKVLDLGLENSVYSRDICSQYVKIILMSIATDLHDNATQQPLSLNTFQNCKHYIDQNFSKLNSVSDVAKKCNVNTRYMANLFKKHYRSTPQEYLTNLKMTKSASLLLSTNMPVKQIAESVGYLDQYHFSRNFKKIFGISPLIYRNRFISNNSKK